MGPLPLSAMIERITAWNDRMSEERKAIMAEDNAGGNNTGTLTITLPNCLEIKPTVGAEAEDPAASMGTGAIFLFAGKHVPDGWLICNGAAVNRSTYADLFRVIGTTYGVGNGSTTFNVPDLRGRFPLGRDDMGDTSANRVTAAAADRLGGSGGAETHTLTTAEMPAHNHKAFVDPEGGWTGSRSERDWIHNSSRSRVFAGRNIGRGSGTGYEDAKSVGHVTRNPHSRTPLNPTGGDAAHNNLPPYLALNYLIKT